MAIDSVALDFLRSEPTLTSIVTGAGIELVALNPAASPLVAAAGR